MEFRTLFHNILTGKYTAYNPDRNIHYVSKLSYPPNAFRQMTIVAMSVGTPIPIPIPRAILSLCEYFSDVPIVVVADKSAVMSAVSVDGPGELVVAFEDPGGSEAVGTATDGSVDIGASFVGDGSGELGEVTREYSGGAEESGTTADESIGL